MVRGFLLCIFLYAILCVFSLWYLGQSNKSYQQTRGLAHARQVHLALMEYAIDHDGKLPSSATHSNAAFRQLFDARFQDERIFFVPGSAWHKPLRAGLGRPDDDVGSPPNYLQGLSKGENHWAYQSGLNNESPGNLPFVMDGFSLRTGVYADDPEKCGGVWDGDYAIVLRLDGSVKVEELGKDLRVYEEKQGKPVDIFSSEHGSNPEKLLNPW